MTNFQHILQTLRKQYKPLAKVARELDMQEKTLQVAARVEGKTFRYDDGKAIVALYEKHCHD